MTYTYLTTAIDFNDIHSNKLFRNEEDALNSLVEDYHERCTYLVYLLYNEAADKLQVELHKKYGDVLFDQIVDAVDNNGVFECTSEEGKKFLQDSKDALKQELRTNNRALYGDTEYKIEKIVLQ